MTSYAYASCYNLAVQLHTMTATSSTHMYASAYLQLVVWSTCMRGVCKASSLAQDCIPYQYSVLLDTTICAMLLANCTQAPQHFAFMYNSSAASLQTHIVLNHILVSRAVVYMALLT